MNRLRWRLARLIAPVAIIAAPTVAGLAILMRDKDETNAVSWLHPKTLKINIDRDLGVRRFGDLNPRYDPGPSIGGTIEGTI